MAPATSAAVAMMRRMSGAPATALGTVRNRPLSTLVLRTVKPY